MQGAARFISIIWTIGRCAQDTVGDDFRGSAGNAMPAPNMAWQSAR
jgi:hypothetical protein